MKSTFNNKKVLITGHTGFKGTWLVHLLTFWGARVYGYSLAPLPHQTLFEKSQAHELCEESVFNTVNDFKALQQFIEKIQPEYIFHLAAQSLVITSYERPLETFMTNIMGTAHVLEAMKTIRHKCIAVMVTTDKVYQNNEDGRLYQEDDKLGGKDPYSASKACDEIIIHSYTSSFFSPGQNYPDIIVSSVRAGNVIGGGDFSENRIIPDLIRAIEKGEPAIIRQPHSIRPWQHVLEPLYAYCLLAQKLNEDKKLSGSYNIGPYEKDMLEVEEIVRTFHLSYGKGEYKTVASSNFLKEAKTLKLDNSKIHTAIGFVPKLNAREAVEWTADWYKNKEDSYQQKCRHDIEKYLGIQ